MLLIVPQPVDLNRLQRGHDDYGDFFESLSSVVEVVDLTKEIIGLPDPQALYVDGPLGPHLNRIGNQFVAERVHEHIGPVLNDTEK